MVEGIRERGVMCVVGIQPCSSSVSARERGGGGGGWRKDTDVQCMRINTE